jgi:hypothetical protein
LTFEIQIKDLERIFKKVENSKQDLIKSLPFSQQLLLIGINHIIFKEELLYLSEERIIYSMSMASDAVCLTCNRNKIKEWLRELENYGMIRIDDRRER